MRGEVFDASDFVVGRPYSRTDMANRGRVGNPSGPRDPHWGSGIVRFDNSVLLLVTLEKDEYEYQDNFAGTSFWWQSQNRQTQESALLRDISSGKFSILLFVRRYAKRKGKTQPFIYCGTLSRPEMEGDRPVTCLFDSLDYVADATGELAEIYAWTPSVPPAGAEVARRIDAVSRHGANAPSRGQGRVQDAAVRTAIERHSMDLAKKYYAELGFAVEDTSKQFPFDLLCRRDAEVRRVEVKGTQGLGEAVDVTLGEVRSARMAPTDLFVVHSVKVVREADALSISGDKTRIVQNWIPEDRALAPLTYRFTLDF